MDHIIQCMMQQGKEFSIDKTGVSTVNPVLRLETRSHTCVGGIFHLNLVSWTLDMKNQ